mmetsp:Transcript_14259/g.33669  ORF Transcript_14259/g.33669 Transcript_14259/m.33669 type:complete len:311 (-) Transcript_14259:465-1397(-)
MEQFACLCQMYRMRLPSTPSHCGVEQVAHPDGLNITKRSALGRSFSTDGWEPLPETVTPLPGPNSSTPTKCLGSSGSMKGCNNGCHLSSRSLSGSTPAAPFSRVTCVPFNSSRSNLPLLPLPSPLPSSSPGKASSAGSCSSLGFAASGLASILLSQYSWMSSRVYSCTPFQDSISSSKLYSFPVSGSIRLSTGAALVGVGLSLPLASISSKRLQSIIVGGACAAGAAACACCSFASRSWPWEFAAEGEAPGKGLCIIALSRSSARKALSFGIGNLLPSKPGSSMLSTASRASVGEPSSARMEPPSRLPTH